MKNFNKLFLVFALMCMPSVTLSADAPAASKPQASDTKVRESADKPNKPENKNGFDIVLLMDSSGSMKKTDPRDYRKAAAKLFISLLGENDRVGVISFGDSAKTLIPLTPNTKANQGKLFGSVGRITSREYSTHIHDAVKKGREELRSSGSKDRVLVLMSDGKLTLGSKEKDEAAFIELSGLIPGLAKENIKLYSVAFTEMSDSKLLEDMAKGTGGFFRFAKTDKDIHVIFSSVFEKMKAPDTIPLEGESFSIDKDIEEAILVITKKAGTATTLIDPAGKKYTSSKFGKNMKWFGSAVFDMITVTGPAVGKWGVKLSTTEGNKVFVITNLGLKSSFDRSFVHRGDKIVLDAWLEKEGGAVKEKSILAEVSFSAEATGPDGKVVRLALNDGGASGDRAAGDGIYSGELAFGDTGEYNVKIAGEGKTFKREKVFHFKSSERPVQKAAQAPVPENKNLSWKDVLVKFGLINAALALVLSAGYLTRAMLAKRKTKAPKEKKKGKKK